MKSVIIFACLIAVAFAAIAKSPSSVVEIVNQNSEIKPDSYNYAVDTNDGTHHDESGQLVNAGSENAAFFVKGSYSFVDPKGDTYTVNYVADENGFHPQGAHLPVAA